MIVDTWSKTCHAVPVKGKGAVSLKTAIDEVTRLTLPGLSGDYFENRHRTSNDSVVQGDHSFEGEAGVEDKD